MMLPLQRNLLTTIYLEKLQQLTNKKIKLTEGSEEDDDFLKSLPVVKIEIGNFKREQPGYKASYEKLLPTLATKTKGNLEALAKEFNITWQQVYKFGIAQSNSWGGRQRIAWGATVIGEDKQSNTWIFDRRETTHPGGGQTNLYCNGKWPMQVSKVLENPKYARNHWSKILKEDESSLFIPRNIDSRHTERVKEYHKMLDKTKVHAGDLGFDKVPVEHLGILTEVNGDLDLKGTKVRDLGNLKRVQGDLNMEGLDINSLGNLESVGGNLNIKGTKINNLGKLDMIGEELKSDSGQIISTGELQTIGGNINLTSTGFKDLGKLRVIMGNLNLAQASIKSLGNIEVVKRDLNLIGSKIINLGKLKEVRNVWLSEDSKLVAENFKKVKVKGVIIKGSEVI